MNSRAAKLEAFGRLLDIMDTLRAECPWDKKQTLESLRHLTIEETYELADAIEDEMNSNKEYSDMLIKRLGGCLDYCVWREPLRFGSIAVVGDQRPVHRLLFGAGIRFNHFNIGLNDSDKTQSQHSKFTARC